jgi:metacaspase-1
MVSRRSKHKALVIGIDKYQIEGANLAGCVNDANDMVNTLIVCGFPPTQIHKVTNERATKARVIKELAWLAKGANPGDVLVVYWSGHGSQETDVDGDEPDRIDEMVIPHDFDWSDESTHFLDDDFHKELTMKVPKGTRLEFILDTCYSGTGVRSVLVRQGLDRNSRYLPNPDQQHILNTKNPDRDERRRMGFVKSGLEKAKAEDEERDAYAVHTACMAHQVSWELEIDGMVRGAMTYNFCTIMRKREGNISRNEFYQLLRLKMANDGYEQIPTLTCGTDEAYEQFPFRNPYEDEASEVS